MLEINTDPESACYGHKCDRCEDCERGVCCGERVVDADLPPVGSWEPVVGSLGRLAVVDGRLQCHVCGDSFHALYAHIRTHGMNADEYRSYFGLKVTTPLASEQLRTRRADEHEGLRPGGSIADYVASVTAEQRSAWSQDRVRRMEDNRFTDADAQAAAAMARVRAFEDDPSRRVAWRGKLIKAKRPKREVSQTCVICGVSYCTLTGRTTGISNPRRTCGQGECVREARRRAARKSNEA